MKWDVTLDTVNRQIGVGIIVLDNGGCTLSAKSMTKLVILKPIAAEVLAALYVAKFNRDLGLQSIIMEGDAFK